MTLSVLVLAAGAGRRFGAAPKQLALYRGQPLLAHSLALAEIAAPGRVLLVLGAQAEIIEQQLSLPNYVVHSQWASGLGSSIAFGVKQLSVETDAVLILLADQIALTPKDVLTLRQQYEQQFKTGTENSYPNHGSIVCAQYDEQLGVPAIFPRRYFSCLSELRGDKGAKQILLTEAVLPVPLMNAAIDIDTPEDLLNFTECKEPS